MTSIQKLIMSGTIASNVLQLWNTGDRSKAISIIKDQNSDLSSVIVAKICLSLDKHNINLLLQLLENKL